MKDEKEKGVDLSLRQFIKNLGYFTGGTALLAINSLLTSCTPEKLKEIKNNKSTGGTDRYRLQRAIPHS